VSVLGPKKLQGVPKKVVTFDEKHSKIDILATFDHCTGPVWVQHVAGYP
jgi:hypothetical protein